MVAGSTPPSPWTGSSITATVLSVIRASTEAMSFSVAFGKPATCTGGGDSALAVDTKDRLYFADLQGLTDISNSVSSDQGAHWLSTCNAANAVGVDRPWIATFGDPQDLLKPGALYQTVDQIGQCVGACDRDLGQVGSNIVEITRSQDGVTFTPLPAQQIEPDGIVSGIVTDYQGGVYIAHTGLVDAAGNITSLGHKQPSTRRGTSAVPVRYTWPFPPTTARTGARPSG